MTAMQNEQTPAAGRSLLPCPFCGAASISEDSTACTDTADYIWFRCEGCGVESEGEHGRDAALAQWNRRPHDVSPASSSSSSVVQGDASGVERDMQGLVRPDAMAGRRWRHKARGTTYTSLGFGKVQCSPSGLLDDENVVIYQGDDGSLWARRQAEFSDGRFEEVEALTPPAEPVSRPAGEGEREAVARLEEMAAWCERGDEGAEGSVLLSASVADEHARDLRSVLSLLSPAAPDAGGGFKVRIAQVPGHTLEEQRDAFSRTKTFKYGDALLVWANEGDLYSPNVELEVVPALQPGGER